MLHSLVLEDYSCGQHTVIYRAEWSRTHPAPRCRASRRSCLSGAMVVFSRVSPIFRSRLQSFQHFTSSDGDHGRRIWLCCRRVV